MYPHVLSLQDYMQRTSPGTTKPDSGSSCWICPFAHFKKIATYGEWRRFTLHGCTPALHSPPDNCLKNRYLMNNFSVVLQFSGAPLDNDYSLQQTQLCLTGSSEICPCNNKIMLRLSHACNNSLLLPLSTKAGLPEAHISITSWSSQCHTWHVPIQVPHLEQKEQQWVQQISKFTILMLIDFYIQKVSTRIQLKVQHPLSQGTLEYLTSFQTS